MKTPCFPVVALMAAFFLSACSTPDSRIKSHQAAFDALPAETQAKIRDGKVEVGYNMEMVMMALGKPDRAYTRSTEAGTSEVWAYMDKRPTIGFGIGVGGGGGGSSVGGGVGVSTGGNHNDDKLRVVFAGQKVVAVEVIKH